MPLVNESAIPVRPTGSRPRLDHVDLLRGWVIILMALDHTRDFFSRDAMLFRPLDLTQTYGALFLTRWITHFCAPVFFFLAGTGAFLSLGRGRTRRDLSWFLVTRGLWLVLLELTLVQFGWTFRIDLHALGGLVIWALGWSMVVLAGLIHLPLWGVVAFGIVMIAGHNLLDTLSPKAFGSWSWLWTVLHVPGEIPLAPGLFLFHRLSAHSLDRSHGERVRFRRAPTPGSSCAAPPSALARNWPDDRFRPASSDQHLWEYASLVGAGEFSLHFFLLYRLPEISAVAALPPDDSRPGPDRAGVFRS